MYMPDAVYIFCYHGNRVLAAVCKMTAVKQQAYVFGIRIFKVLEEASYEGYMVVEAEQDPAKANPLEYAIRARKFIAEKTGL